MIILGVTLSTRLNSVLSFSAIVTTMQDAKTIKGLRMAAVAASTSTALKGKRKDTDTKRITENNDMNNTKNHKKSTVAIIGGGIAGLSCARHLQHSYDVTVYDTGRLRPGGRCSSRQPNDRPKDDGEKSMEYPLLSRFRYDHAAQFITSTKATATRSKRTNWRTSFDRQVQDWIDQDVLRESPPNSMYVFERETKKATTNTDDTNTWNANCLNPPSSTEESEESNSTASKQEQQRFCYPSSGMSSLVDALVTDSIFDIRQDVWVSPSSGVRYQGPPPPQGSMAKNGIATESWSVRAQGRTLGKHDHLIIAHNGKCADRLMSKTPAKDVHRLLRTNFNDRVSANGGQRMTLNSIYSLTFCVKSPSLLSQNLPESFVGGFVQDHPRLGLVTCQTNKYPTSTYEGSVTNSKSGNDDDNIEVWTVLSTATFAKKNKAPQEFLPEDVVQNVTRLLVDSLERDILQQIGAGDTNTNPNADVPGALQNEILESRVQLWGAGVPLNVWRGDAGKASTNGAAAGFVHDPRYQVGVCGDWLQEASIAGAWTSGHRLAQHLIDTDHSSASKYVGFKKGHFEASQSVRQLGLASLDGPMNSEKIMQSTTQSSPQIAKNRRNGSGNNNNNNRKNNRNRSRKETPTA